MIRLEDLRNAIDAVSRQDAEIGYALNELMAADRIGLPVDAGEGGADPCFLFEGERVFVRKVSFFNHGTAPLEERLVLKYGEAAQRHAIEASVSPPDYFAAANQVRRAGLDCLVRFEIERAVERLRKRIAVRTGHGEVVRALEARVARLQAILQEPDPASEGQIPESAALILHSAEIELNVSSHFIRFPFSFVSLRQVAQMNLEFFHLRFVLDLLAAGAEDDLYAGMSRGKLTGLMLLGEKRRLFYRGIEVRYVSTINGVPVDSETVDYPRMRGAGTFLMAGAWLVWKECCPHANELILDAELGAGGFYEQLGFDFRPPFGYVLKKPRDKLLLHIVTMAMNRAEMPERLRQEIAGCIEKQVRYLKKSRRADDPKRKIAILIISSCIRGRENQWLADAVQSMLQQYQNKIPESDLLLQSLAAADGSRARRTLLKGASMVLAVCDPVFEQHLEGVFHLESRKRIRAIETILAEEPFPERVVRVQPRAATENELAWVHDPAYIAKIAETAGHRLSSLDLDTQTTAQSYATARLAVGGVFSLIDAVLQEKQPHCGIACVRPPGHHAEPDRAMGFCLFNNIALGAQYLRRQYGVKRVLIADIDVHHGNGIQKAFYESPEVLYFSVHQFPCYPGTGRLADIGAGRGVGYTINMPLSKGRGDGDYALILHHLLAPVARAYAPEVILVALGFDLYAHDPLGQMNVTPEGYALLTHMLKSLAGEVCSGHIVFVLEGGYSQEGILSCGRRVFQELADLPTLPPEKIKRPALEKPATLPELRKVMDVHKKYWPVLQ